MRRWVIAILLIGLGAPILAGCGSSSGVLAGSPGETGTPSGPTPMAGGDQAGGSEPETTTPPQDIEAILTANAGAIADLGSLSIDRRKPNGPVQGESRPVEAPARETVAATITEEPTPDIEHEITQAPVISLRERISKITQELAMLLKEEADQSDSPVSSIAALSALEMIVRGVAPDPATMPWLNDRERELLTAFRDLLSEAGERLESDPNDLLSLRAVIEGLPDRLDSWKRLSIPVATLCVRVDGFGQYEEFGSNTIVAGRAHRMIVYTELADFRSESATGPGGEMGWRVRLTQDLSLYHDADGLLAWREANQKIDEFSRNERHDFFLVQLIELPRTLTVGKYRLKVMLVDEVAGATAEAVISIDVVADAGLVGR